MVQCTLVMKDVLWRRGQRMGLYTRHQRGEFCSSHFQLAKTKPKAQGSHLESLCMPCPQDTGVGGANQALGDKTHYWNQEEGSQTLGISVSLWLQGAKVLAGECCMAAIKLYYREETVCLFIPIEVPDTKSQVSEKGCVDGQGLYLSPYVLRS